MDTTAAAVMVVKATVIEKKKKFFLSHRFFKFSNQSRGFKLEYQFGKSHQVISDISGQKHCSSIFQMFGLSENS